MTTLTLEHFRALFPHCPLSTANEQVPLLNATMQQYRVNNKLRIAAFCATLAQESGEFRYRSELASGAAYEGRRDLGNVYPGDGVAFKGHARIQITGRTNHAGYARYVKTSGHLPYVDFSRPELAHRLAQDPYALDSAGWFWSVLHDLNSLADHGDFLETQRKVNGYNKRTGLPNHWKERNAYYQRALSVLPDDIGFDDQPEHVDPGVSAHAETPEAESTAPRATDASDLSGGGLLNHAMASEGAKQAGKALLTRGGFGVLRVGAYLWGALEAGNVIAWLGVVGVAVLVLGAAVVIYLERKHLRRWAQWLIATLKGVNR